MEKEVSNSEIRELEQKIAVMEMIRPGGIQFSDMKELGKERTEEKGELKLKSHQTLTDVCRVLELEELIIRDKFGRYYRTPKGIDEYPKLCRELEKKKERCYNSQNFTWNPNPNKFQIEKVNVELKKCNETFPGSGWIEGIKDKNEVERWIEKFPKHLLQSNKVEIHFAIAAKDSSED